jgi:hypothetical protein
VPEDEELLVNQEWIRKKPTGWGGELPTTAELEIVCLFTDIGVSVFDLKPCFAFPLPGILHSSSLLSYVPLGTYEVLPLQHVKEVSPNWAVMTQRSSRVLQRYHLLPILP